MADLDEPHLLLAVRSASMRPLMPSPGSPKTTDTPQSRRRSTSSSAVEAFFATLRWILRSFDL